MLISYKDLVKDIVDAGVIENVHPDNINGSSIDIVLGNEILVEAHPTLVCPECGKVHSNSYQAYAQHNGVTTCSKCGFITNYREFVKPVDFSKKEPIAMRRVSIAENPYILQPGEVCLAHSVEVFNLPMHITAEYRLKSSMARIFLEHLHAGWCDPGWNGSVLTLEFCNMTKYHPIVLRAGEKCGQVMFYLHTPVPEESSYAVRGKYNGAKTVEASKGVS